MTENITPVRMAVVWKLAALRPDGTVAVHGPEQLLRVLEPGDEVPAGLLPMTEGLRAVLLEALEALKREKTTATDPAERTLRALETLAAKPAAPITINLPAQAAPVVNVEVPARPAMRKVIVRDGADRIASVVEEPMEEPAS